MARALGVSLEAILSSPRTGAPGREEAVTRLRVDEIAFNPDQPRSRIDEATLRDLSASILAQGVVQPIVVRPREEGGYWLVAGERRLRASKLAGLDWIPAVNREAQLARRGCGRARREHPARGSERHRRGALGSQAHQRVPNSRMTKRDRRSVAHAPRSRTFFGCSSSGRTSRRWSMTGASRWGMRARCSRSSTARRSVARKRSSRAASPCERPRCWCDSCFALRSRSTFGRRNFPRPRSPIDGGTGLPLFTPGRVRRCGCADLPRTSLGRCFRGFAVVRREGRAPRQGMRGSRFDGGWRLRTPATRDCISRRGRSGALAKPRVNQGAGAPDVVQPGRRANSRLPEDFASEALGSGRMARCSALSCTKTHC